MFVKDNKVSSVREYFKEKLINKFSPNEIKTISDSFIKERLQLSNHELILSRDLHVSESDLLYFREVIKRILSGEPFQYVIGHTDFFGLSIKVSPSVLIPRPESEELVDWIVSDNPSGKIIDLCTGSGCMALALKDCLPNSEVYGTDISEDAIEMAKLNSKELKLETKFFTNDILKEGNALIEECGKFDVILSNPPYVLESDKTFMSNTVIEHEPQIALFVTDEDPLLFYREIALFGLKALKENGVLYFEIHEDYGIAIKEMLISLGYFRVELKQDLQDKDRMVKAILN